MAFVREAELSPPHRSRTWRREIRVLKVRVVHSKMHKLDHSCGALVQVAATAVRWGPLHIIKNEDK